MSVVPNNSPLLMDDGWTIQAMTEQPSLLKMTSNVANGGVDFGKDFTSMFGSHEKETKLSMDISMEDTMTVGGQSFTGSYMQQKHRPSDPTANHITGNKVPSGPSMRQVSLDTAQAKPQVDASNQGRHNMFSDVMEQLAAKEEALPGNPGLYTLPSMQFLESLLDEMDSFTTHSGQDPIEPPLYLPIEAFDLADTVAKGSGPLPFGNSDVNARRHSFPQTVPTNNLDGDRHMPPPLPPMYPPVASSAAASPVKGASQQRALPLPKPSAAFGPEGVSSLDVELALRRNNPVHVGVKRKIGADQGMGNTYSFASAPAAIQMTDSMVMNGSEMTISEDDEDEVTKGNKSRKQAAGRGRKGRRTICLNCGNHQTPQWRCGPLGPRTLCNACGVRYKKGLPLTCWPIKEGLTLQEWVTHLMAQHGTATIME